MLRVLCVLFFVVVVCSAQSDLQRLLQFTAAVPPYCRKTNWDANHAACTWEGVGCTNGVVTSVQVSGFSRHCDVEDTFQCPCLVPLDLTSLPVHTVTLSVSGDYPRDVSQPNSIVGALDLTKLPANLQSLSIVATSMTGTMDLRWLPKTLVSLTISGNSFGSSVEIPDLRNLTSVDFSRNGLETVTIASFFSFVTNLDLSGNRLSGNLNFARFPFRIQSLNVASNRYQALPPSLPGSLVYFDAAFNKLSGSLDLTALPPSLSVLSLGNNQLNGSLDLTMLPASLSNINLDYNYFSGPLDLTALPASLSNLNMVQNQISGVLDLSAKRGALLSVNFFDNLLTGVRNVEKWIRVQSATLGGNQLTGTIPYFPDSMRTFVAQGNHLSGSIDLTRGSLAALTASSGLDLLSNDFCGPMRVSAANSNAVYSMYWVGDASRMCHGQQDPTTDCTANNNGCWLNCTACAQS